MSIFFINVAILTRNEENFTSSLTKNVDLLMKKPV